MAIDENLSSHALKLLEVELPSLVVLFRLRDDALVATKVSKCLINQVVHEEQLGTARVTCTLQHGCNKLGQLLLANHIFIYLFLLNLCTARTIRNGHIVSYRHKSAIGLSKHLWLPVSNLQILTSFPEDATHGINKTYILATIRHRAIAKKSAQLLALAHIVHSHLLLASEVPLYLCLAHTVDKRLLHLHDESLAILEALVWHRVVAASLYLFFTCGSSQAHYYSAYCNILWNVTITTTGVLLTVQCIASWVAIIINISNTQLQRNQCTSVSTIVLIA